SPYTTLFRSTEAPTYYPNPRIPYPIDTIRMFYFTDRSIYRPGQTVYFKGILLKKRKGENGSQIVEHHSTTVTLYDANGQKVDSLSLQTNDFGTRSEERRVGKEGRSRR